MPKPIRLRMEELCARINPAGALDPSFGDNGIVLDSESGFYAGAADTVLIQPDGKIVAAGTGSDGVNSFPAVFRFNSDGTPDTTFSHDGIATFNIRRGSSQVFSAALQQDGKIVVTGTVSVDGNYQVFLARFDADGSADTSFGGGDGVVLTDESPVDDNGFAVAIQPDGRIVVGGSTQTDPSSINSQMMALRYNTNGSRDNTFGNHGVVKLDFGPSNPGAFDVKIQGDGKIVLAGTSSTTSDNFGFALARLNANGSPDTTFGDDGLVLTAPSDMQFEAIEGIALLPDGKILAAGGAGIGPSITPTPVLLRYMPDGSLDTTFDDDGIVTTDLPSDGGGIANAIAVQTDGDILLGGLLASGSPTLTRYLPDGQIDTNFGPPENSIIPGVVVTNLVPGAVNGFQSVAIQPDGKIVAAGAGQTLAIARFQNRPGPTPVSVDDEYTVDEDSVLTVDGADGLLANDTVTDTPPTSISVLQQPAHGTLELSQTGAFVYTPDPDFSGTDSFVYMLDNGQQSFPATVSLSVTAVNDAPVAVADNYVINAVDEFDVQAEDGLLANDTDADGDPLTVTLVTPPEVGGLLLNSDGSFALFLPEDFIGQITFQYQVSDGQAESAVQTVTLTREAIAVVDGTRLFVYGTEGIDSVQIRPTGGPALVVELQTPNGLVTQTYRPSVPGQSFGVITAYLAGGNDSFDSSGVSRPVSLVGGDGDDTLTTGAGADTIFGDSVDGAGTGADVIDAGSGVNVILAGDGDNQITTAGGNDFVTAGNGNNTINTGSGIDIVTVGNGSNTINTGDGSDSVTAGNGNNTIDAGNGTDSVTVGDGINSITAGGGNDTVMAGTGGGFIDGGDGNDFISVLGGNNHLLGGDGNDVILGGDGADSIEGGAGKDLLSGGLGADTLDGGIGNDMLFDGAVIMTGQEPEVLAAILASYVPSNRATLVQITQELTVTPDTASADSLVGGGGTDWFWTTDGIDTTDRLAAEPLNSVS
ncbi:tandem-95 repeat protein [Zavarzinella formosa]|uniref:tandem-95 repeat protein n=1 Tax=Zavarzinella formosa TaxID=360055 RepID=UPI0002E1A10D|nr:Ig-like domain-containing protein [Zavarzinella formosa]